MILEEVNIRFVNIGIELGDLPKSFSLFGLKISIYGLIIAIGIAMAMALVLHEVKRTGQRADDYIDFALIAVPACILGARIYYVVFEWDYYREHLTEILNIRKGGLAIYGAVIVGVICCVIFTKIRHMSFFQMADTACLGLLVGQIIGRWGNFFNREAFGGYTDNLFAMQLKYDSKIGGGITQEMIDNMKVVDGIQYIQVHPTFLYESLWNLGLLILILFFRKKKKYDGQVLCWYIGGYALGRYWIESLRTDQLKMGGIPISMLVAAISAIAAVSFLTYKYILIKQMEKEKAAH